MKILSKVVVILALASCVFAGAKAKKLPSYEMFSLEATPCYGACAAYEIVYRKDFTAEIILYPFRRDIVARNDTFFARLCKDIPDSLISCRSGLRFVTSVSKKNWHGLEQLFDELNFFELEDYVEKITDLRTIYVSASRKDVFKRSKIYGLRIPSSHKKLIDGLHSFMYGGNWVFSGTIDKK